MSDRQQLLAMRVTIVVFTGLVLAYAIAMQGTLDLRPGVGAPTR